jgi:site-specific DNA-methyltransferase (adenine-specific)
MISALAPEAVSQPTLTPAEAGIRAAQAEAEAPTAKPWLDKVVHGDCRQVLRRLPDACVDMVLTDPPYLVRYTDRSGRQVPNDDNGRWIFPAFSEMYRVMKPDRYCLSFYGWGRAERFLSVWKELGFRPVGHFVWVKRYASCTRHTKMKHEQAYLLAKGNPPMPKDPPADVLEWNYTGNRLHPTQKPVSGLVPLIRAYTKAGELVADPFAGSGTTGVAARQCNRRYLLIEQDEGYYRVAQERLTQQVPARLI